MTATRTYSVPGISCGHCKAAIEAEVTKLDDVDAVAVDVDARLVTVVGAASAEVVTSAIDEVGYDVAGVSPA